MASGCERHSVSLRAAREYHHFWLFHFTTFTINLQLCKTLMLNIDSELISFCENIYQKDTNKKHISSKGKNN